MLKGFRSRLSGRSEADAPSLPAGVSLYAIGDIHGRLDLLQLMAAQIRADAAEVGAERTLIVPLGDYIDRGPQSRGVVDLLLELEACGAFELRALKGNHEQALLDFLQDASGGPTWMQFGGAETLAAYGVSTPRLRTDLQAWEATREALAAALPRAHLQFFQGLESAFELGDYFFVHAGIRPNIALDLQDEQDMLWIRHEFLEAAPNWSKTVVHGHTPIAEPFLSAKRIGLDTGAYATGALSALRLIDKQRKIIQVTASGPGR